MRYIVFTAKHDGGFCLFDSQLTDYKITSTAFGRDVESIRGKDGDVRRIQQMPLAAPDFLPGSTFF